MVKATNEGEGPTQEVVKGSGTLGDPQVILFMTSWVKGSVTHDRREACIQMVYDTAIALDRTHVYVKAYNHDQRFLYDTNGNEVVKRDSYGQTIYNAWGNPFFEVEDADNHIPCDFYNSITQMYETAHVYVVIDIFQVPRRLMLMNERRHIKPWDYQSPQLWRVDQMACVNPLATEPGGELQQREVTLFMTTSFQDGWDMTRAGFNQMPVAQLTDLEFQDYYAQICPYQIEVIRNSGKAIWTPSFESESMGMSCPPVRMQLLYIFFSDPEVRQRVDDMVFRRYLLE